MVPAAMTCTSFTVTSLRSMPQKKVDSAVTISKTCGGESRNREELLTSAGGSTANMSESWISCTAKEEGMEEMQEEREIQEGKKNRRGRRYRRERRYRRGRTKGHGQRTATLSQPTIPDWLSFPVN